MNLIEDWKKMWKSYSQLAVVANILQALSVSALAMVGVLSYNLAFPIVVGLTLLFGTLGFIGRLLPQKSISGDKNA